MVFTEQNDQNKSKGEIIYIFFLVFIFCLSLFYLLNHKPKTSSSYKLKDGVYYYNDIKFDADVESFQVLGLYYAKDRDYVFYEGKRIQNADPKTFQIISVYPPSSEHFSFDKNNVYYEAYKIPDADPKTFSRIEDNSYLARYSKDDNHVFCKTTKVPELVGSKLKIYGQLYLGDDKNIFYANFLCDFKKLEGVDIRSFVSEAKDYGKDKKNVYLMGKLIEGASPATFKVLDYFFSKDKDHAYTFWYQIKGADVSTFEMANDSQARDKNRVYNAGSVGS